jgi:diguanylate cyclase (GGDEF)-like protein
MSRVDASRRTLEQTSKIDPLTGLLNRAAFFDTANKAFSEIKKDKNKLVMMFADLDKFKLVNDTHGHQKGDQVLKAISGILKNNIRQNDIAARYGGDEFVLILKGTNLDRANEICGRIRNEIRQWSKDNNSDISLSVGLGEAPTHGTNIDDLLAEVDKQLYKEKRARLH